MAASPNPEPSPSTSAPPTTRSRASTALQGSPVTTTTAGNTIIRQEENIASKLLDPHIDLNIKIRIATDLRESADSGQRDADYRAFIDIILPAITGVLRNVPVSTNANSSEHRLRHLLLETLHRLPHSEPLKPQVAPLMDLLLELLHTENEENATMTMKIIIDLHRSYKESLVNTVDQFLSTVKEIYSNMPDVVAETFDPANADRSGSEGSQHDVEFPAPATPASGSAAPNPNLPLGMKSFKVLTECPIAIVFLFQSYREVVAREIKIFVPLIFEFLGLQPSEQARAHEEASAEDKVFVGICSALDGKRAIFNDLLVAQVKTMSFLAYVIRVAHSALASYKATIPQVAIRMLKDIPPEASANRKELLVATRHILSTDFRMSFLPHLDMLLDEHVLIGTGTTAHETLRPLAYSMIADLVHHVRTDLNSNQLSRVVHAYSCNLHDPTLAPAIQTMCCKLLLNVIESIITKERDVATQLLNRTHEAFVRKMEGIAEVRHEWAKWGRPRVERKYPNDPFNEPASIIDMDEVEVERARPMSAIASMTETHPDSGKAMSDVRFMFRTLITGSRSIIQSLKHIGVSPPDALFFGRIFRAGVKCLSMYDVRRNQGGDLKEVLDIFTSLFQATDLLVFQEVFENNMGFYLDELLDNHELLAIPQHLLSNEAVSQAFVGIVFRFLVARLDRLGNEGKDYSQVVLRLFKMACMAVTIFPETNEAVLQPHLSHIIMDSLKLASQAKEPSSYYILLRTLFRSIGGGRFELLYKEVLPLLQTLLENLNGLINSSTSQRRDLFVELCLTVPVRLSVLLPFLTYLMKPLVLALQAGSDLISQGLRTLELCVDNLTQEFLGPLMSPVIHDIMAALWKLLRPLPHNPQHAHTTMRILGKIGGRNRRLLGPPQLQWKQVREEAVMPIHFDGTPQTIIMAPLVDLAARMFKRGDVHYRKQAYLYLKHSALVFLKDSLPNGEPEEVFGQIIRGLFDAARAGDSGPEAEVFLRQLAKFIFTSELSRELPETGISKHAFPLSSALLDAFAESLAASEADQLEPAADQITSILADLLALRETLNKEDIEMTNSQGSTTATVSQLELPLLIVHQLATKVSSLCYEQSWHRKTGGAVGISLLVRRVDLGSMHVPWMLKHETDFVRALLFMLKDMPADPPGNVEDVSDTLLLVVRECNEGIDLANEATEPPSERRRQFEYLVGLLIVELSSQVAKVRETAKAALKILSECTHVSVTELLRPVRERLLGPIFTKPLRALAFSMQVGFIDAVTFCITLDPPLIEFAAEENGETSNNSSQSQLELSLSRLLTEALGIADADDAALTGRQHQHKNSALLTQLRVVCVNLLSAALSTPEYTHGRQQATRVRILQVYFKLLYSRSPEVVEAVYSSLKVSLREHGKLPKDLLQVGLRPVLLNLSDHKRLSVSSLQGLARLLELLTNYFKVEIGTKLLDHFRALASDLQALTHAALNPQNENGELAVMAAIINIFRLLPHPAASQFLNELTAIAVQVETQLKKVGSTSFTKPLAGYLDRYPTEACAFFFSRVMDNEQYTRTFCSVLACPEAENLRAHVSREATTLLVPCFGPDKRPKPEQPELADAMPPWRGAVHGAQIIRVLTTDQPDWLLNNQAIITCLIQRWISKNRRERLSSEGQPHLDQLAEDDVMLDLFLTLLPRTELYIDLLFHIVDVFTFRSPTDHAVLRRFFHNHVAANLNVQWKRAILDRFFDIFESPSVSEAHKTVALRVIVNPILMVAFNREDEPEILDQHFITKVHQKLWQPGLEGHWTEQWCSTEPLKIELLFMSTLIVRYRPRLIAENRKDVIKFGWVNIKDEDPTVKNVAHSLIAHFLAVYDSPAKIINSIFTSLLKTHQPEGRTLVREALDVLSSALPHRGGKDEDGQPMWLKWTRRTIIEEGHATMSQLAHVYHLIVRHPDLYFPRRDMFIVHMISNLPKLALTPTSTAETKALAVDLVELLIKWDRRRKELVTEQKAAMDVEPPTAVSLPPETHDRTSPKRVRLDRSVSTGPEKSGSLGQTPATNPAIYTIPHHQKDSVINALIRLIANTNEPIARPGSLCGRALGLLKQLLADDMWPDVSVKLGVFRSTLGAVEISDANVIAFCNTAETLAVVVAHRSDDWVLSNLQTLQRISERGLQGQDSKVHETLKPILQRLFTVMHPLSEEESGPEEAKAFIEWASNTINEALRSNANTSLASTLVLLHAWAASGAERIDPFTPNCIRCLTRLTKEVLGLTPATTAASATPLLPDSDPTLQLLMSLLVLFSPRISFMGEHRRWLLSALVQLVEKCSNLSLWRLILDTLRTWIIDRKEPLPTLKEKAVILQKMQNIETRNDEGLVRDYFQLILDIYTDPAYARSELTVRLESAFLHGCRTRDAVMRCKFLEVFDHAISRSLFTRLHYILGVQSWETLAEASWIHQALDLLLGAVDADHAIFTGITSGEEPKSEFEQEIRSFKVGDMIDAARKLLYADATVTQAVWVSTFKASWACFTRKEQADITTFLTALLSKEYHLKNIDRRPNNVQALLAGVRACSPLPSMSPHLVRYLGKTFNAWHTAAEILQETALDFSEEDSIRESTWDAMAEIYSDLSEDDLFYGLWRRRCYYNETSIALSFEQNGMWQQAQHMHEAAQTKARTGVMPFTESEYSVWEDHWVICAQKLQQWDILADLARHEGNAELMLECSWRLSDWAQERESIELSIKAMNPVPTPRKRVFEAYMALVRSQTSDEKSPFPRICDDGIQLALRKWFYLPEIVSEAHIPLLQVFQQFVELQEAGQIFASLAVTNSQNLDQRSQELKNILQTWRERLPNLWDDINVWSDLVAWRQHVFSAINKAYIPLVPMTTAGAPQNQANNSYAYRGYHETAWIINRFAHVARKHHLSDVCITSLTKIYTLPNIEIQEAFLKLREQAKCHYQNPAELTQGLEVINNTNLGYFNPAQKAEFYTLKGMFLAKLGVDEEAKTVFNQAITMDMSFPKGWAEWGHYHDRVFKSSPTDLSVAANAVSCYLQAAGLYKNAKVRKLLVRILWLLSLDDVTGTISKAFDTYKGEVPVWYWITFIPQLLLSLSHREARYARIILMKVAKSYPQSLYFLLRTTKEDLNGVKRTYVQQQQARAAAQAAAKAASAPANGDAHPEPSEEAVATSGQSAPPIMAPAQPPPIIGTVTPAAPAQAAGGTPPLPGQPTPGQPTPPNAHIVGPNGQILAVSAPPPQSSAPRHPWEHVDEIVAILKTAFPLLALSMETFCDQIQQRFKQSQDEDIFRLVNALLNDALVQYITRATHSEDLGMPAQATINNVARVAENLQAGPIKSQFEEDFVKSQPSLQSYVLKLQKWRDRTESTLDRKARRQNLEHNSHWLVEFPYHKFDEIEVPGQYLKHEDTNANFVRIDHFHNKFEFGRSSATCYRRLTFVGHDGSVHPFAIQLPSPRHCRREERIVQFFRMLNCPLSRRKESRKRNLTFHVPVAVPLAPHVRLLENDSSVISLHDVWEQHCRERGMGKDEPIMAFTERLRAIVQAQSAAGQPVNVPAARLEVYEEIALKMFPDDVLKKFMIRTMSSASDLWHIRKQMTLQMASFLFMTYIFSMGNRTPSRIHFSRTSGLMHTTDMLPSLSQSKPQFENNEPVPFRFTPNLQCFMTAIGAEGILTSALLAIARSLTESEYDLEHRLSIFVREEVMAWHHMHRNSSHSHPNVDTRDNVRDYTLSNIDAVVTRAKQLSCRMEREKVPYGSVPANQTILDLLSAATNVPDLAQMDVMLLPWL